MMIASLVNRLLATLLSVTVLSCATVTSDRLETIDVMTSPAGADAALTCADGTLLNHVTPATMRINRKAGACALKITKDGFQDTSLLIEQWINGRYWGNFGFSPMIPFGGYLVLAGSSDHKPAAVALGTAMIITVATAFLTDVRTGAIHAHEPRSVAVTLAPKQ